VESLEQSGFFNPVKVQHLLKKIKSNKNVSEVDAMALAGIYSSQLLDYHFVKNRLATINKTIHPATIIDKRNI
jgi:asparagine synthase (glutamine-hydrolysing)